MRQAPFACECCLVSNRWGSLSSFVCPPIRLVLLFIPLHSAPFRSSKLCELVSETIGRNTQGKLCPCVVLHFFSLSRKPAACLGSAKAHSAREQASVLGARPARASYQKSRPTNLDQLRSLSPSALTSIFPSLEGLKFAPNTRHQGAKARWLPSRRPPTLLRPKLCRKLQVASLASSSRNSIFVAVVVVVVVGIIAHLIHSRDAGHVRNDDSCPLAL